jgi:hypothetical protein
VIRALSLISVLILTGCTHSTHLLHVGDFSPSYRAYEQGELISVRASQPTFMGFVGQTDYVNEAYDKLLDKCRGGVIQGVTTQYQTSHGFFSWTNEILMQGICVRSKKT